MVIYLEDRSQVFRLNDVSEIRGARIDHHACVQAWHFCRKQSCNQATREHVLADRDKHGPAKLLAKEHQRYAGGNVDLVEASLRRHGALLHAEADAEADEDLVADPLGVAGVSVEGREEAGGDGYDDSGGKHKGDVVAEALGAATGEDGADDEGEDEGDGHDAGFYGGDTLER